MACNIERFEMSDKDIKNWCKHGCSVDCYKFLLEKYPLKEKERRRQEGLEWAESYRGKAVGWDEVWGIVCEFDDLEDITNAKI